MSAEEWVSRWDRQQEGYVPFREARFEVMFDVMASLIELGELNDSPTVLDLACGPGAIGQRLLQRFPNATYHGIDIDPVLVHLARQVGLRFGDRYTISSNDLVDPDWARSMPDASVDVVASSTALHWLSTDELRAVIASSYRVLRSGGVFLNADNLAFGHDAELLQRVATRIDDRQQVSALDAGAESWKQWWSAARSDAELGPLCVERDLRFPPSDASESPPPELAVYLDALASAGFVNVGTVWQRFDDRVVIATKASSNDDA